MHPYAAFTVLLVLLSPGCTESGGAPPGPQTTQRQPVEGDEARTAILGLFVGRANGATVQFVERKDFAFNARLARAGAANVRVEVFTRKGSLLGLSEARVHLCDCPQTEPHYEGDVEVPHETTALIKVPWREGGERVRVSRLVAEGAWREVHTARIPEGAR